MKQIFNKLFFVLTIVAVGSIIYISNFALAENVDEKDVAPTYTNTPDYRTGQYYYDTIATPTNTDDAAYNPMVNAGGGSNPTTTTTSTDTGRGTGTGTGTPTSTGRGGTSTPIVDDINLIANLDKSIYNPNDVMVLTTSAMMSVSLGYVPQLLVTGAVANSGNSPIPLIDNMNGGKSIYGGNNFTAPKAIGDYILTVKATQTGLPTYSPGDYKLYDSSNSLLGAKHFIAWAMMKNTGAKGDTVTITTDANGVVTDISDPQSISPVDINILSTYASLIDTTTQEEISIEQSLIQVPGVTTRTLYYDIPFSVVSPSINNPVVTGPSVTVWTNSDCGNSDRSDRKKVRKNNSTIVCWEATGLGKDAYCTSPDQPANGPTTYPTTGSFNTNKILATKDYVVTCQDKVVDINDAGTGKITTGGTTTGGGSACFVSGTLITLADGTTKNIQDVKIGDVLKGGNSNNTVLGFHQPLLNGKKLYSFNNGNYFVTAEHPFKTIDGWKSINPKLTESENIGISVSGLKVGDTLITDNGNVLLTAINSREEKANTQLYNFLLTGDHTYYADGYLVHNKTQAVCDADGNCHAYTGPGSTGGIWTYSTGGDPTSSSSSGSSSSGTMADPRSSNNYTFTGPANGNQAVGLLNNYQ